MHNKKTYIFVAGRSGGHIIPGLSLARIYKKDSRIIFITTDHTLDRSIMSSYQWIDEHHMLELGNVPRTIWGYPKFAWQFFKAFHQMMKLLKSQKPQAVIAMGGYSSLPVCVAAWIQKVPFDLYELNVEPGKAVFWLSRYARTVCICFKQTASFLPGAKTRLTHYPIRFTADDVIDTQHARKQLGLSNCFTLLILGGSQGSRSINKLMMDVVLSLKKVQQIQVIHQTGVHDRQEIQEWYTKNAISAVVFDFKDDMAPYYCAADKVVARAGAGTLFELLFFNKQSIIIPLITSSTAHQKGNAQQIQRERPDLFTVLEQSSYEIHNKLLTLLQS